MEEPTSNGSLNKHIPTPEFAPADPSDGRKMLDWRSKYKDPAAKKAIWLEAIYLAFLLYGIPLAILILWLEIPKQKFGFDDQKYSVILRYGLAWLGGALGGTLYNIKWLYHVVARQLWHVDRRLWRLFTPHISGGLAFAIIALISSGLFRVFDQQAVKSHSLVLGMAFMVGYFSDNAAAKLTEIAATLFGTIQKDDGQKEIAAPEKNTTDQEV